MNGHPYESNRDIERRQQLKRYLSMRAKLDKEITPTMVAFVVNTYVLSIEDESYGHLTIRIRERRTGNQLHLVRFKKQPGLGVVYEFMKADRLSRLYIERAMLPGLETAAATHAGVGK